MARGFSGAQLAAADRAIFPQDEQVEAKNRAHVTG
jgi:hypothetical protein